MAKSLKPAWTAAHLAWFKVKGGYSFAANGYTVSVLGDSTTTLGDQMYPCGDGKLAKTTTMAVAATTEMAAAIEVACPGWVDVAMAAEAVATVTPVWTAAQRAWLATHPSTTTDIGGWPLTCGGHHIAISAAGVVSVGTTAMGEAPSATMLAGIAASAPGWVAAWIKKGRP